MLVTTYEQFKNLPQNRGLDTKTVYKRWLLEENKLILMYDSIQVMFNMQFNPFSDGIIGPSGTGAGGSSYTPIIPTTGVTYYTPNGSNGLPLGYYTPDLNNLIQSYYIYV